MTDDEREAQSPERLYEWSDKETIERLRKVIEGQGLSMQAMGKEIDEACAEIARLRAASPIDPVDAIHELEETVGNLEEERNEVHAKVAELGVKLNDAYAYINRLVKFNAQLGKVNFGLRQKIRAQQSNERGLKARQAS